MEVLFPGLFTTQNPNSLVVQSAEVAVIALVGVVLVLPLMVLGFSLIGAEATSRVWNLVSPYRMASSTVEESLPNLMKLSWRLALYATWPVLLTLGLLLLGAYLNSTRLEAASALAGGFGLLGLIVGGITLFWTLGVSALAPSVVVIEGAKPAEAFKRSRAMLKVRTRDAASLDSLVGLILIMALIFIVTIVAYGFVKEAFGLNDLVREVLGNSAPAQIAYAMYQRLDVFLSLWACIPLWGVGTAVIYLSRRVALEGLDIRFLNDELVAKRRV